ncbi:hypothetical protein [Natrinema sp. HArc-T2]|uniref:hypothetical protein n=1 Tax=Natrinema sp. HArc-T2 TaxID=3242701 RepID=UPI00359EFBDC
MSLSQSSVFDKFTFFGVLIPGVFASALLYPFLPTGIAPQLTGFVIYLTVVSFTLGMFFNGLGELIGGSAGLTDSVDVFTKIIRNEEILWARNKSDIDRAIVDKSLSHLDTALDLDHGQTYRMKQGDDFDKGAMNAAYQYMLNQVWAGGNSPAKIHHSVRMLCRSLVTACFFVGFSTLIIILLQQTGLLPYDPIYISESNWVNSCIIAIFYAIGLSLVVIVSVYIHKQYTYYLCIYMLSEFVRLNN